MNATVTYKVSYEPHPWDEKLRAKGVQAWCLVQVITPEMGPKTFTPVALFNWDSDAERFQGHVLASGLNGKLVEIDPSQKEHLEFVQRRKSL